MSRVVAVVLVASTVILAAGCDSSGETADDTAPMTTGTARTDTTDDAGPASADDSTSARSDDARAPAGNTTPPTTSGPTAPSVVGAGTTTPGDGSVGVGEAPTEPEGLGPLGSTDVEIDTGAGTVQIGSGDIPDVVPPEFPIPDDLDVQLASAAGDQVGFSGVSQLGFDELVALYRSGLSTEPFKVVAERIVNDSLAVFTFDGAAGRGEVAISSAPGGGHSVLVTFAT